MTSESEPSPSRRILEAVVSCIEKDGLENLTTRRIAEEAGTNVAAINYYFRTKDRLVAEALSMTLQHMLDDLIELIDQTERPFLASLEEVFVYLIEGGLRFPRIIMAHMYAVLVEKNMEAPVVASMRQVFDRLVERAQAAYPEVPPGDLRLSLSQVFASVLFMTLSPEFFQPVSGLNLSQEDNPRFLAKFMSQVFALNLTIPEKKSLR